LDTIKVRIQSQLTPIYKGSFDCLVKTVRHEGFLALYKGMLSPVLGNAPLNAVVFGAYGNANRVLDHFFPQTKKLESPSYWRLYSAGCWAGLMQCLVCTPVELVKCKLQNQKEGKLIYKGTWDCVKQMVKANGLRLGLYRGWWSTVWRDVPSFGLYFVTYEYFKYELTPQNYEKRWGTFGFLPSRIGMRDQPRDKPAVWAMLVAGGMAGITTWLSTYPFDVLKSSIQTLPDNTPLKEQRILHVARKMYQREGWTYFVRGLSPALIRAVPVNAVTFWIYEESLRAFTYFEKKGKE